jgi:hypothetical protein
MEKVSVGIIGSGLISSLHAAAYKGNPRARLYAICDLDEQLLAARKDEWGMEKAFADYRELLADPGVDAIEGKAKPLLSGEQGREILKMSFAIYHAARKRRDVYLEELERPFPGLYAWGRRRKEKRESFIESFKKPLFARGLSRFAPQARELTEQFTQRFDAEAAVG